MIEKKEILKFFEHLSRAKTFDEAKEEGQKFLQKYTREDFKISLNCYKEDKRFAKKMTKISDHLHDMIKGWSKEQLEAHGIHVID